MKAIMFLYVSIVALIVSTQAFAFTLTLPEPISVPIATELIIEKYSIDENRKTITVEYIFKAADKSTIYLPSGRGFNRQWVCSDTVNELGVPTSTCFTDVYGAAVNGKVGVELWNLIWAKMKPGVLKVKDNDVTSSVAP